MSWDRMGNAQRVDETGFGRRLVTYDFAVDGLMPAIAAQMQAAGGTERAGRPF